VRVQLAVEVAIMAALWLMQHGMAEKGTVDDERPLTAEGRVDVEHIADGLTRISVMPEQILHSGKLRALQTAEIVGEALGVQPEYSDGLAPESDVAPWLQRVGRQDLMLVSHLPFLTRLISALTCETEENDLVRFTPGTVVRLEEEDRWRVAWMLTPWMAENFIT
jgi:phosphohistidine phosphatase